MFVIDSTLRGRLAIVPRPRGGDWLPSEVGCLKADGVDVVASLLETREAAELGLADEACACAANGIDFVSVPVPDRGVPGSTKAFLAVAEDLRNRLAQGSSVGIHCRACIGRAAMLAVVVLVLAGDRLEDAWARVEQARCIPVPDTDEQRRWVESLVAARVDPRSTDRS